MSGNEGLRSLLKLGYAILFVAAQNVVS